MPSDEYSPEELNIRLSFSDSEKPDVEFWSKRLSLCGVEVLRSSRLGIDAKGRVADIERALNAEVSASQDGATIKLLSDGLAGHAMPIAYVPRKPNYF